MDNEHEPAEPAADEQRPSPLAIVIAVVAVVAVLGFGGWLLTRSNDDQTSAPAGTEDTSGVSDPGTTDDTAATDATTSTTSTALPETTPLASLDPAVPPESSSASPPASLDTVAPTVPSAPTVAPPPAIVPPPLAPDTTTPAVPGTVAPDTTIVESTPPTTAPTAPPSTLERPPAGELADLVPNVAGERVFVGDEGGLQRALIDTLLATPRHDVASPTPVTMVCAVVAVDDRRNLGGRWEVDGRPLLSSDPAAVAAPGFGACVDADGEDLPDGAYQFVAIDASGATSAAGTFVAGATRLDQQLRNNSDQDVCAVLIGPATATYYEAYRFGAPVEPGDAITIALADVRQDARTIGCNDEDELAEFSFDPSDDVQPLVP